MNNLEYSAKCRKCGLIHNIHFAEKTDENIVLFNSWVLGHLGNCIVILNCECNKNLITIGDLISYTKYIMP